MVEPTDDVRATNPATHERLLQQLSDDFIQHGFNLRHTIRVICSSETYGRSSRTVSGNESDDRFYSHALVRTLEAEVLADALTAVTGVADQYGDAPLGTRAVTLHDSLIASDALDILGRCAREASCESGVQSSAGLTRKLHLVNGDLINRRIVEPLGNLQLLLDSGVATDALINEFYLRGLSRPPSDAERSFWHQQFDTAPNSTQRPEIAEDFLWSLLTCQEFVTNH